MLALRYSQEIGGLDLVVEGDGFSEDETTATLVAVSLFTDARDDSQEGIAARGYWADDIGSSLWTFLGKPQAGDAAKNVAAAIADALAWLEVESIATVDSVVVENGEGYFDSQVELTRGEKTDVIKWGREAGFHVA